jgi:hypothetical protein
MAASTITRSALTNGTTPWSATTINSAVYDKIDELFGGAGTYATLELGGALKINGALTQLSNDGGALGTSSLGWSDLFLASGAVINFNNGDVTLTHSTNTLTFAGASSGYVFDDHLKFTVGKYLDWGTTVGSFGGRFGRYITGSFLIGVPGTSASESFLVVDSAGATIAEFRGNKLASFGGNIAIGKGARFYLDGTAGTGNTYLEEYSDDEIRLTIGGSAHSAWNTTGQYIYYNPPTSAAAANAVIAQTDYIRRSTSSIRYKHDIATLDGSDALAAVMAMRPVTYRGKTDADQRRFVGFIAEEVQQWAPLLCTYDDGGESGTPNYVTYDRVTAYLVAVVQQQQSEISALKARID